MRGASHEQLDTLLDKVGPLDGVPQTQTSIVLSRKIDRRNVGAWMCHPPAHSLHF